MIYISSTPDYNQANNYMNGLNQEGIGQYEYVPIVDRKRRSERCKMSCRKNSTRNGVHITRPGSGSIIKSE